MDQAPEPVRVDKWLWAARLTKTRALAVDAIKGGRVEVNGQKIKPSKDLRPGDRLQITKGQIRQEVIVRGLALRRGPAAEAELLYEETAESRAARERFLAERRLDGPPEKGGGARPTKRDRRRLEADARARDQRR